MLEVLVSGCCTISPTRASDTRGTSSTGGTSCRAGSSGTDTNSSRCRNSQSNGTSTCCSHIPS